jgi:hypothetical protein
MGHLGNPGSNILSFSQSVIVHLIVEIAWLMLRKILEPACDRVGSRFACEQRCIVFAKITSNGTGPPRK